MIFNKNKNGNKQMYQQIVTQIKSIIDGHQEAFSSFSQDEMNLHDELN